MINPTHLLHYYLFIKFENILYSTVIEGPEIYSVKGQKNTVY